MVSCAAGGDAGVAAAAPRAGRGRQRGAPRARAPALTRHDTLSFKLVTLSHTYLFNFQLCQIQNV